MVKRKAGEHDRAFHLASLGRASYASKSAIAGLLADIEKYGMPETYDRSAQYRARKEICRQRQGDYGPLVVDTQLPLKGGKTQKFSIHAEPLCLHNTIVCTPLILQK